MGNQALRKKNKRSIIRMEQQRNTRGKKRNASKPALILNDKLPKTLNNIDKTDSNVDFIISDPSAPTDHYILKEVKGPHADTEDINFVLTEGSCNEENSGIQADCREEIQIEEEDDEMNEAEAYGDDYLIKTKEIVEHICGKCYQSFRTIKALKRHREFCAFNSEMLVRREEMLKNLEKIEKEAFRMEIKDICFCCGDSYDTCHLGHITCNECPKTFKTQMSLERHMFLIHSEKNDFPCTICNGRIRSETLLKLHIQQHETHGKPFACKHCGKDFTRQYHLKRHNKFSGCNGEQAEAINCAVCGKEFVRMDNLRMHLKTHLGHGTQKKSEYMCPCCKKCFASLSTLNIHIRTHTGERPFDCDLCDKNFPSLVSLKKHRRYHTGEKPYTCSVCNQNFAVKEVLNRHMKRHTGEKPHGCPECGKRFIQATQLKNHLRTHLRPHECHVCPEKFKTEKQLDKHFRTHTKNIKNKDEKFSCRDCKVSFKVLSKFIQHEKSADHIINCKRLCLICSKEFPNSRAVEFHMLKEHEPTDVSNEVSIVETSSPTKKKSAVLSTKELVKQEEEDSIIIEELIVESFEIEQTNDKKDFTIIAKDNEVSPNFSNIKKSSGQRGIKAELKKSLEMCLQQPTPSKDSTCMVTEEDNQISENVSKLLGMLLDAETLKKVGYPNDSVESVLCKVIENCGYNLYKTKFTEEYSVRMREYVKLLFTVVIQNDTIKELLNNYPIDEVIEFVLSNGNDDEDE